ncbi:MAG: hypothetical protein GXP33_02200 [Spirochaetes bacterium]|nr:hypothetical protein [Spirochaetota bacterium]
MIFTMIRDFYREAAGKEVRTGMVIAHQTAGNFLRFNSHYHGIVLEGGFDEAANFVFIPFGNLDNIRLVL